ncbi:MAG: ABC transporter ATP-binding protein [Planctomycetota bacterium]
MPTGLCAQAIGKSFAVSGRELVVLRDVSLTLERGEAVAIMGPSGSGKSTLLNILGTLERPTAGRVLIDGQDPFELTERELARFRNRHVGFVFQDQHLLAQCSVLENVLLPTLAMPASADATPRARDLLDRVGLAERLDHSPAELSGGERQRVALARALINRPALVLADEPTGNLDRTTARSIAALLGEVHARENVTLVVVTHSAELADRFERRFELVDGALVRVASSGGA